MQRQESDLFVFVIEPGKEEIRCRSETRPFGTVWFDAFVLLEDLNDFAEAAEQVFLLMLMCVRSVVVVVDDVVTKV